MKILTGNEALVINVILNINMLKKITFFLLYFSEEKENNTPF